MTAVLLPLTIVCMVANAFVMVADLARAKFVLANSAEVGVKPELIPYLGLLKAAGIAGLAIGLAGITPLGVAAAVGLVLFYLCAVDAHVRASVYYNIAFPLLYLALAASALAYFLAG